MAQSYTDPHVRSERGSLQPLILFCEARLCSALARGSLPTLPTGCPEARNMDEAVREFLQESTENLDRVDRDILDLEQDASATQPIASLFRTIHTIKGTCGFFGFGRLEKITHTGENILGRIRDGKLAWGQDIGNVLLEMVDEIRRIMARITGWSSGSPRRATCCWWQVTGRCHPPPWGARCHAMPRPGRLAPVARWRGWLRGTSPSATTLPPPTSWHVWRPSGGG